MSLRVDVEPPGNEDDRTGGEVEAFRFARIGVAGRDGCGPPGVVGEEVVVLVDNLASVTRARLATREADVLIRAATEVFADTRIELIVVCSDCGPAVGVVSKVDLVRHLVRDGDAKAPLSSIMTSTISACLPSDDLTDTWLKMTTQKLRSLPVLGPDRRPLGTLDIRDALEAILHEEEIKEHMLVDYIAGYGYR